METVGTVVALQLSTWLVYPGVLLPHIFNISVFASLANTVYEVGGVDCQTQIVIGIWLLRYSGVVAGLAKVGF